MSALTDDRESIVRSRYDTRVCYFFLGMRIVMPARTFQVAPSDLRADRYPVPEPAPRSEPERAADLHL